MAMATSTAIALGLAAAAAGAQAYNTNRTAERQDDAAANAIRNQSRIQRKADAKVNERVQELEGSTAADERQQALGEYMEVLRASRANMQSGLTPTIGGAAFREDAANDAADVQNYAADTAGLMSRIDAAGMQRQGEAFGYGNLTTDIGLIGRESRGQDFMDQLRLNSIRRNPWIDMAAGIASAGAGTMMGSGASTGGGVAKSPQMTPVQYGGRAVYGTTPNGRWT